MAILGLLLLGIILIEIEILFIPGTTVVGVAGFLVSLAGLYLAFKNYGEQTGWIITGGFVALMAITLYFGFKGSFWRRFALKDQSEGKAIEDRSLLLTVGEIGKTRSALRPMGTAEFQGKLIEVNSQGTYIKEGELVKVIRIENNNIIVESLT
jgi:membrane-bound ClpP family serine protease